MDPSKYRDASKKAMECLISNMDDNAEFHQEELKKELSALYKLPTQLLLWGKEDIANKVFDNIKKKNLQPNGDFYSYPDKPGKDRKTVNPSLAYYWPYINGWITSAAHRAGRFDISVPAWRYLKTFYDPVQKGFLWAEAYNPDRDSHEQSLCAFMSAHLGFTGLFLGDLEICCQTGDTLIKFLDRQPCLDEEFLLKMDNRTGELLTSGWSEDTKVFFRVKRKEPNQLYFQIGYPAIFLAKLYQGTGENRYLETAKRYLDFALSCDDSIYTFVMSHKVAYAAALVAAITKDQKYANLAARIADNILTTRAENGLFLDKQPLLDQYDQTAENIGWMREIAVELEAF